LLCLNKVDDYAVEVALHNCCIEGTKKTTKEKER
jgi:hypothetical protein